VSTSSLLTKKINLDDCYQYVEDQVFCLRPQSYCVEYSNWPGQVGIELEQFVLNKSAFLNNVPQLLPLHNGGNNLSSILQDLAKIRGWSCNFSDDDHATLMNVKLEDGDQLTFEPGGQLEFSSVPYPCLSDALARLNSVSKVIEDFLSKNDAHMLATGINPWQTSDEIGLQMNKARYRAMNEYFSEIGPYGPRMMRQTATIQVNLDFGANEQMLAKRFLAANLIAPLATGIFAASPQVNTTMSNFATTRAEAWRHIDPSRTGVPELKNVAESLTKKSCVEAYLKQLLDAPVIFVEKLDYQRPKGMKFSDWLKQPYQGVSATMQDFVTHMSLHFPEVRARGFLELRSVDAQASAWQSVPAAFYTGLLYVDEIIDEVIELLAPKISKLSDTLNLASYGLERDEIAGDAQTLMALALRGFQLLPDCFKGESTEKQFSAFAERFTNRGRSPADDMRYYAVKDGGKIVPDTFKRLDDDWLKLVE